MARVKIPVYWLNYHAKEDIIARGYWDQQIIEELFANERWQPADRYEFEHVDDLSKQKHAIVVIPARHHAKDIDRINKDIAHLDWCILMLTGDEESEFPIEEVKHYRFDAWVMSPMPNRHDKYHKLGSGYAPGIRRFKAEETDKPLDWFFSGQVVHSDREQCAKVLRSMLDGGSKGVLNETDGFTKGYPHEEYYGLMQQAKIVPSPAGKFTPDSFRAFEALEMGCVPIVPAKPSIDGYPDDFWPKLFGEDVPFPIVGDWDAMSHNIGVILADYPKTNNKVYAWWQGKKRDMAYELRDCINYFERSEKEKETMLDKITAVIPTSPIKSHPSTYVIEQTISSIRERLPEAEILIMIDGIREEQLHMSADYEEYKRHLIWMCNNKWTNILPIVFDEHTHQARMTRETMKKVHTTACLFVEHDTPLTGEIDFEGIYAAVNDNKLDMVRLHHETTIGDYHQHLMHGIYEYNGVQFTRTEQWSQRPHVANADYYRRILRKYFTAESRTMIEDKMHSVAQSEKWDNHRLAVYTHEGNMQHSLHTDGRKDDPKYDMVF